MDNETKKIFGRWYGYDGMRESWFESTYNSSTNKYEHGDFPSTFPTEDELIFASYGGGAYEGDATLVWKRDGKFYEAHGSHCSCYGLEGQFNPEETSLAALARKVKKEDDSRWYFLSDHDGEAYIAYWNMVNGFRIEEIDGDWI